MVLMPLQCARKSSLDGMAVLLQLILCQVKGWNFMIMVQGLMKKKYTIFLL